MSMYATKSGNQWTITANLRNTGSASATINLVLINGRPAPGTYTLVSNVVGGTATNNNIPVTLDPGGSCTVTITLNAGLDENLGFTFTPGMSVEVTFHTAAGSDYPKVVVLP